MNLRAATLADLPAIRGLHTASWRSAYRGILSDRFLDAELEPVMAAHWADLPGDDWLVLCAVDAGAVTGFAAVDRAHEGGPYLDNLHTLPDRRGQGIGRRLLAAVARDVSEEGARSLWLTVMRDNEPARRFYRRLGGQEGHERTEILYGDPIQVVPVRWHDLTALARDRPG